MQDLHMYLPLAMPAIKYSTFPLPAPVMPLQLHAKCHNAKMPKYPSIVPCV